jgi:hypothetical protein
MTPQEALEYKELVLKARNLVNQYADTDDVNQKNEIQKELEIVGSKIKSMDGPVSVHLTAPETKSEVVTKPKQGLKMASRFNGKK